MEALGRLWNVGWSIIPGGSEFWSAIAGAIVGGVIAYIVQVKALREGRQQRAEDHQRIQRALGNSLLFKMLRIHSNFYGIHRHIEECFEEAAKRGFRGEPWQIVLQLANPPDRVHFSADEMGMLLAQKDDDVFNSVMSMDVIHNSLIDAVVVLNAHRTALQERLTADEVEGTVVSGYFTKEQMQALRPKMMEINVLIECIRASAKKHVEESGETLAGLHKVLRGKLGLRYKLESQIKKQE